MKKVIKSVLKAIISWLLIFLRNFKTGRYVCEQILDGSMNQTKVIDHSGVKLIFAVPNSLSNYRADSFSTKEPETLEWIDSMPDGSVVWDIGANVGIYSCYAAKNLNCNVYAFEPSVFNLELLAKNIEVPGDLSSSAFFIVAALINQNSKIKLKNININPTRNGILLALEKMGAKINLTNKKFINNEKVADIFVKSSKLHGCELDEKFAKLMIDEYPILSVAAAYADSPSIFKGLSELRLKESNRLELIKTNLLRCGCHCEIKGDDLFIKPLNKTEINQSNIKTDFDHRIAMAFAVMGSKIGNLNIQDPDSIKTSFPNFVDEFNKAGGNIIEK